MSISTSAAPDFTVPTPSNYHPSQKNPLSFSSLPASVQQVILDHQNFNFKTGSRFTYHPPNTIILGPPCPNFPLFTLHELGHALSQHRTYKTFIKLLKIEREAWERARPLAKKYRINFDTTVVESSLDTYRNHLHRKSLCPACHLNRFQDPSGIFHCPHCDLN